MSSLLSALKTEIARIARKEVRTGVATVRKLVGRNRSELAELKRRIRALESRCERLSKDRSAVDVASSTLDETVRSLQFSPRSIRAHRKRVGLSAKDYARLVGVSMQSIYHWEQGKSSPRRSQLQRLSKVSKMGKRAALQQLALVMTQDAPASTTTPPSAGGGASA